MEQSLPVRAFFGKAKPKRKTITVTKKVAVAAPAAAAIRQIAKQAVKQQAETKFVTRLVEDNVQHNSQISAGDFQQILPLVQQGTQDWQRIGDTIRPTSLVVRGMLAPDATYANTNQVLMVRVVIISAKATKNLTATTSLWTNYANTLLRPNLDSGTQVVPFVGNQPELLYPINSDEFIVHMDKVFKIAPASSDNSEEENPASTRMWKKTIKLPKKLTYDVGIDSPNNFCPFMGIGYVYADGTGPDVLTTKIVSTVTSRLAYKDT